MAENRERVLVGETPAGVETKIQTDSAGTLAIVDSGGVPTTYTACMTTAINEPVNMGQLNEFRQRPIILNEHAESGREVMETVVAAVIVGQIFKASADNINSILLNLESAEAETTIDDIEEANDAALQAAWVKTGTNEAVLETTIISTNKGSTKSMKLDMDTLNDLWTNTKAATSWDMTGATIEFDYYQTIVTASATMTLSINDGANTSALTISIATSGVGSWHHFSVPVDNMSGTADVSAVTNVFFKVTQKRVNQFAYVDNVRFRPAPGSVTLKLWDCGTTLPVGDGATFDLTNDATQYSEIGDRGIGGSVVAALTLNLQGGKRYYHIEGFVVGVAREIPANTLLTVGNYYAITINYVDTDVSVYGPNTTFSTDYYTNGYAFSTSAENVDITKIAGAAGAGAYSDLIFGIFSTQQIYVQEVNLDFLDANGALTEADPDVNVLVLLEDENMEISSVGGHGHGMATGFDFDLSARPQVVANGGKVEAYYNAGINDSVASVTMSMKYLYIPPTVNG